MDRKFISLMEEDESYFKAQAKIILNSCKYTRKDFIDLLKIQEKHIKFFSVFRKKIFCFGFKRMKKKQFAKIIMAIEY